MVVRSGGGLVGFPASIPAAPTACPAAAFKALLARLFPAAIKSEMAILAMRSRSFFAGFASPSSSLFWRPSGSAKAREKTEVGSVSASEDLGSLREEKKEI